MRNFKSWLCASVFNEQLIDKCIKYDADIIHYDIEDSVPDEQKERARLSLNKIFELVSEARTGKKSALRINSLSSTEGYLDLLYLKENEIKVDILILPKARLVTDLQIVSDFFGAKYDIYLVIENTQALKELRDLTSAPNNLKGVIFGAADYALDIGMNPLKTDFKIVKTQIVQEAARLNINAIDSPSFELRDEAIIKLDCAESKQVGFLGKIAVHPFQVKHINESLLVSSQELKKITQLVSTDMTANSSIGRNESEMAGPPMIKYANRVLKEAAEGWE